MLMERENRPWAELAVLGAILLVAGLLYASVRAMPARENPVVAGSGMRTPVLVELFTSEGCSSCPPADGLLERLDRSQPITTADIVVLSEHVDYWDDLGWRDPYSSHAFTERQQAYAEGEWRSAVYTPQMVVDGRFELVGSDEPRARQAIENAARGTKTSVALSSAAISNGGVLSLHIDAAPLPATADADSADVLIAIADESDESQVRAGENDGRKLQHVAVLRSLTKAGVVGKNAGFSGDVKIPAQQSVQKALRAVGIVQTPNGRVWGVASARMAASS